MDTPEAYAETAVALAADQERRRGLRIGLWGMMRAGPLGDGTDWVVALQNLIRDTLAGCS